MSKEIGLPSLPGSELEILAFSLRVEHIRVIMFHQLFFFLEKKSLLHPDSV